LGSPTGGFKLDLDAPVRAYLPELGLADEDVATRVTLRHLFTHTGGWEGDYFEDTGWGDDALARIVAHLAHLPQLTPLGALYAYNNAGFYIAGRVIEVVTGKPYETVARELVLDPLGMTNSFFLPGDVMTRRFAVGHQERNGQPQVARPWPVARSGNPVGGLTSTVRDQLTYARFHLGDGTAANGKRLLTPESLRAMQQPHGPGGNDIAAVGIPWLLRDLAGTRIVRHGGATLGQLSAFQFVPSRGFAITILTNADRGDTLNTEILAWAFAHYLGLRRPDEPHLPMSDEQLAAFAGTYTSAHWDAVLAVQDGYLVEQDVPKGGFPDKDSPPPPSDPPSRLAFIAPDRVLGLDAQMKGSRSEFLRDDAGRIVWYRNGGRLLRRKEG
jgi:CubicO group peptidase (beta-lactamase class C family)